MMTREKLELEISDAIHLGREWIYFLIPGDVEAARQRLIGHHFGPYGRVVGNSKSRNVVCFNAPYISEYMEELPHNKLEADAELNLVLCDRDGNKLEDK